uniref:ATP synthase complex subunit 8 n=1 Tax=Ischnoptera deropeltiformis TaxID=1585295 RepID=A0A2P1H8G8_9NEOP|nr:ATP synthase F0 subunit 8 [Ischnoptera deropeltiformis]
MPQMMPMSWLILFMFFSLLLMLFNFMNYYSLVIEPPKSLTKKIKINKLNWKW